MALGLHYIDNVSLDSSSNPDDTTVFAAPGANQRTYIHQLVLNVTTSQASAVLNLEEGASGDIIRADIDLSSTGTTVINFKDGSKEGYRMDTNTAINAEISGATGVVATISGEVRVRGQDA